MPIFTHRPFARREFPTKRDDSASSTENKNVMTNIGIEMSLRHILSEKFLYDESTYLRLKDNLIAYTADYRLAYRYIQTSWWKAEEPHHRSLW